MKTKFIPILIASAAMCVSHAQDATPTPTAENRGLSRSNAPLNGREDELRRTPALGDLPATSTARFGQRLATVVRRGDGASPGSIILTSPMPQKDVDEMSEDLTVLNYIFSRNLERAFGEKATEYRLGVPITMSGGRLVDTSFLQDFGVLVKVHVPFPLISPGENEKKSEPIANANTEWEKARRTLFGGDSEAANPAADQGATYDEKIVEALKKQMFEALASAANVRHIDQNQSITAVILGGAQARTKPAWVVGPDTNAGRPTVMTIRVTKAQADGAAKDPSVNDLSKYATITAYFDTANSSPRGGTTFGGGYGANGFGGGYGGFGGYPSAYGVGGLSAPSSAGAVAP